MLVLLGGINHVAVLTADTDRFLDFYRDVFEATHETLQDSDGFKVTLVWVGPTSELNVFVRTKCWILSSNRSCSASLSVR